MDTALDRHRSAVAMSASQAGAVSLEQLRSLGWSALQAWNLERPELPVHVEVPRTVKIRSTDELVVTRPAWPRPCKDLAGLPPVVAVEHALIDASRDLSGRREVIALFSTAMQKHRTHPDKLEDALERHKRFRHRSLAKLAISSVLDGATTVLEIDGLRNIFTNHGLPTGEGQVRSVHGGKVTYRDRYFKEYDVVVEFDGQLGHFDAVGRYRDSRRDNSSTATGAATLRFDSAACYELACESALDAARAFRSRGWPGWLDRCGPSCRAISK